MQKSTGVNRAVSGFTAIEMMLAFFLVGILLTIGFIQFSNFARDKKNTETKERLALLRNAIQKQYGQMRLRCNLNESEANLFPDVHQLASNDITASTWSGGDSACSPSEIPQDSDRQFVPGGIPDNPWSDPSCSEAERRAVYRADGMPTNQMDPGVKLVAPLKGSCGWIYSSSTGRIKANSNNNVGYPSGEYESSY